MTSFYSFNTKYTGDMKREKEGEQRGEKKKVQADERVDPKVVTTG